MLMDVAVLVTDVGFACDDKLAALCFTGVVVVWLPSAKALSAVCFTVVSVILGDEHLIVVNVWHVFDFFCADFIFFRVDFIGLGFALGAAAFARVIMVMTGGTFTATFVLLRDFLVLCPTVLGIALYWDESGNIHFVSMDFKDVASHLPQRSDTESGAWQLTHTAAGWILFNESS